MWVASSNDIFTSVDVCVTFVGNWETVSLYKTKLFEAAAYLFFSICRSATKIVYDPDTTNGDQ